MTSGRLEAFSDGVLAIIITVMVLGLAEPKGDTWADLVHTSGLGLLTYLLSFVYIGIYWSNHHHLMHLTKRVDGGALWANLNLLFWLSLVPFTTRWMDESSLSPLPVLVYGFNLLMNAVAYTILQRRLIRIQGADSRLADAIKSGLKEKVSTALYLLGCAVAFLSVWGSVACYTAVAILWIVPDRRIERAVESGPEA